MVKTEVSSCLWVPVTLYPLFWRKLEVILVLEKQEFDWSQSA